MPTYKQNAQYTDLLPDGKYPFYVRNCKETTNKHQDPMFMMTLEITGPNGDKTDVYDNLNFGGKAAERIDQFRLATGEVLGPADSDCSIEAIDFIGRRGVCYLETTEYQGRKRNSVTYNGYVINQAAAGPVPAVQSSKRVDPDDIPF
jgi:hypothetical protein